MTKIIELCLWLHTKQTELLTLAGVHLINPEKVVVPAWLTKKEQDYLIDFVGFLKKKRGSYDNSYHLLLDYIVQSAFEYPFLSKAELLFQQWITAVPQQAIAFFEDTDFVSCWEAFGLELYVLLSRVVTRYYYQQIKPVFAVANNPLCLIPLMQSHYLHIEKTAAFITCLLEQKCSVLEIIHSGILHWFFLAHAAAINLKPNPIAHLYDLIAQFTDTTHLCRIATAISAHAVIDGASLRSDIFAGYSLMGHLEKGVSLTRLQLKSFPLFYLNTLILIYFTRFLATHF